MQGLQDGPSARKPRVTGNVYPAHEGREVLAPIAAGLVALIKLFPEVREALAGKHQGDDDADPWIDQEASPLGRRAHCRACASGCIPGARKVRRKWLARQSAIDAYIAENGTAAIPRSPDNAPANDTAGEEVERSGESTPADVDALLRRVNLQATAPRTPKGRR